MAIFRHLYPSEIGFTQHSIAPHFQDGRTLLEVALQLARSDIQKRDIPMINVVLHSDGYYYSLDNRRLAVFRLLEIVEVVSQIKVRIVPKPRSEWRRKYDTFTEGQSVQVRKLKCIVGVNGYDTTYPLAELKQAAMNDHAIFYVEQGLDGMDSDSDDSIDPEDCAIHNDAHRAQYGTESSWSGAHKRVYKGVYTRGNRKGAACVVKEFKDVDVYHSAAYSLDLKSLQQAKRIIAAFNATVETARMIWLNDATVWRRDGDGVCLLVEPMIEGKFLHFNSNTGYERDSCVTMGALSHFSYHFTGGKLLLCDLQGGQYSDHYILTDPVIMSNRREQYGPSDLGPRGIEQFFSQHRCTKFCDPNWAWPENCRQIFQVVRGSTLVINGQVLYGTA